MTAAESARLTLSSLQDRMEECRAFYSALGLCFARTTRSRTTHLRGRTDDSSVFEIYPPPRTPHRYHTTRLPR